MGREGADIMEFLCEIHYSDAMLSEADSRLLVLIMAWQMSGYMAVAWKSEPNPAVPLFPFVGSPNLEAQS